MTNNWQKRIQQLQQKKFRKQERLFVVEGAKSVVELLNSKLETEVIFGTSEFLAENSQLVKSTKTQETSADLLAKVGSFKSNDGALAVVRIPRNHEIQPENNFILALDEVRDPGNLGTILRIADWYGFGGVVCSQSCADVYNPKVIASSMGSFTRTKVFYCNLQQYLAGLSDTLPVYGAFMDGDNVHKTPFGTEGVIILGNESNGVSNEISKLVNTKITIPRFGEAESLNVAMAGAIIADNVRRNSIKN
ncbi:MAG: TrmH family RNA methyltransferase [Arenicella sp.]|jgi:TrmH family RNA methyltransferase